MMESASRKCAKTIYAKFTSTSNRAFISKWLSTSPLRSKTIPSKTSGGSSHSWLTRQLNDPYVKLAKFKNYRARSAFKLLELDDRFRILKPGDVVVECGSAPGAWTQVCVQRTNSNGRVENEPTGRVIGLDLRYCEPVEGATVLCDSDVTLAETHLRVSSLLDGVRADTVLSDMAPDVSGIRCLDAELSTKLAYAALRLALSVLRIGGTFGVKVLEGGDGKKIESDLSRFFPSVKYVKPAASRKESPEIYFLARNFVGIKANT